MDIKKEDYQKIEDVYFCGTNKGKYRNEILYLFSTYIDNKSNICLSCKIELLTVFKKFQFYFDTHFKELIIKSITKKLNEPYLVGNKLGL
jgi:hypothetical protein